MSDAILTGVTLHRDCFGDPRFEHLAILCGHANHHEARGRMALLWSMCTALGSRTPPRVRIVAALGHRDAPEHLVESGLGERLPDGQVRVCGGEGRLDWYGGTERGTAGGAARANGAPRDERGRLLPRSSKSSESPASHQQAPASSSEASSDVQPKIKDQDLRIGTLPQGPDQICIERGDKQDLDGREGRAGSELPEIWVAEPGPELDRAREHVRAIGGDPDNETAKFIAEARAKGWRRVNWTAALVKWLRGTNAPPTPIATASAAGARRSAQAARDRDPPRVGRIEPLPPECYPTGVQDLGEPAERGPPARVELLTPDELSELSAMVRAVAANPEAAATALSQQGDRTPTARSA